MRQEVGLNGVLPSNRLGCGRDAELGQLRRLVNDAGYNGQFYLQVQVLAV